MTFSNPLKARHLILFFFLMLAAGGCTSLASDGKTNPSPLQKSDPSGATQSPSASDSPTPLSTQAVKKLFIAPYLPDDFLNQINIPGDVQKVGKAENSNLQIDVGSENPISSWVYAVAAPFPTVTDGIKLNDLTQLWSQGKLADFPEQKILIDQGTYNIFKRLWGNPASAVKVETTSGLVSTAWDIRKAWVILPFEQLEPRWKVLEVDGFSPLQRNFSLKEYPLTINISLKGDSLLVKEIIPDSKAGTQQTLAPASNRDSQKLTTINMTGVTAMVRDTARLMEVNGMTYPADQIRGILRDADFLHISNEIPYKVGCPPPIQEIRADLVFCSKPEYNQLLEDIGANIIELSGDHFQDWGPEATLYTLDLYKKLGWKYYGGGYNLEDGRKPLLIEHNGNKLAFIGCNAKPKGYAGASETSPGAVHCDFPYLTDQIQKLRNAGYIPIVTFQHVEYYSYSAEEPLITDFHRVAQAGAEIVSGSQGHQPQAIEFFGSQILHYGLGNLFFDQYHEGLPTRQAFIDRHVFYGGKHISTELITIMFIDNAQSRLMTKEERQDLLATVFKASGW